ncbi:MAG: acyltransferase [Actinomycetota bacterium]|nr:acyltransferase [Actinomycetota bacterium]
MTLADTAGRRLAGPARLGHVPALDGIRGIAVVGVLLFHAGHLRGGFLGVDLFFVLSGFLITTLLVEEWQSTRGIDLRRFWARRVRRLLPAALVLLLATTVYAALELEDDSLGRYRGDALAAAADVANWRAIATDADYWAAQAEPSPLRHMWSLSIEEQLYLAWPLLLLVTLRWGARRRASWRWAVGLTVVLYGASVAALVVLGGGSSTARAYYGTDTRASAVLVGGLSALLLRRWRGSGGTGVPEWVRLAAPTAALALTAGWLWAEGTSVWLYQWGFPLFGAAAAVVVIWAATASDAASRALAAPVLTYLGTISYATYLIHWPVYVALDEDSGLDGWSLTAARVAITIALATISLRLVERPVRSGRVPTRWWRRLALGGLAAVVGSVLVVTAGAESSPSGSGGPLLPVHDPKLPRLLLLGDSQAVALAQHIDVVEAVANVGQYSSIGCGIGPGLATTKGHVTENDLSGDPCDEAQDRFVRSAERAEADVVLLHAGAWDIFDRRLGSDVVPFGTARWDEVTRSNLRIVLGRLAETTDRLVVLAAPCYPDGGRAGADVFGQIAIDEGAVRVDTPRVRRWNELLREVAGTLAVDVLPYDELFCDGDRADDPERPDGVHVSPAGADQAWSWIVDRLDLAGPKPGP